MRGSRPAAGLVAAVAALLACAPESGPREEGGFDASPVVAEFPGFTDVTGAAGITFVHDNGATERRYLPETMGAGVAVFDYDGDGAPDLFFVDGAAVEGPRPDRPGALYRNLGGGRFADVTEAAGLAPGLLGMGVAIGDVDGDDDLDLVVTGVGGDLLFRNRGDGTFRSGESLPAPPGFGIAAAFLDGDGDGDLDLFLGRYVEWSAASDVPCRSPAGERVYCTPEAYPPISSRYLRNLGGGTFEDRTEASGLAGLPGKALGVLPLDVDDDGRPDLAVANDTAANQLLLNRGDGTFVDEAVERGLAFGPSGSPRGGMGIDGADLDLDGDTDVVIGNFALESSAVFAEREGQYRDVAAELGFGIPSLVTLAFGTLAEDLDGDARPDLLLVNGHIEPRIAETYPSQSYRQPPLLMLHPGSAGTLRPTEGKGLDEHLVGRGAATGDLDADGDPDLVVTQNGGPARIYRNDVRGRGWLTIRPRGNGLGLEAEIHGTSGPRNIGTSERSGTSGRRDVGTSDQSGTAVIGGGEAVVSRSLVSGRSYLSAPEPVIRTGVDRADRLDVTLRWPGGRVVRYRGLPAVVVVVDLEEAEGPKG